ncbi:hypothetical protein BDZ94DRAFT_1228329 [Collybia nuda]|uniref:Ubiquitin carboxyl-terminal hydrolase n=1 Tax=Collybia nuda TaxID=64659 RepID=A0A9P6C9D1_9AGAR|nr:hypothetical protein BDZ94DRAFT_1228329 [Collybia nuda]
MPHSCWIPLENNPDVLNAWAAKAGLVLSSAQFGDVYGLDPELLALVPQPVKAVILLFPISDAIEAKRKEEDAKFLVEQQPLLDPTVLWIKQTIPNACGTIGLLHALANSDVTIMPGSPLSQFVDQCKNRSPEECAKHLETTPLFANNHAEAAYSGQTVVPNDLRTNLHFTCFVAAPSVRGPNGPGGYRVVELDGRRIGPIDRGECIDLLSDAAKVVKNLYLAKSSGIQFSMVTLGPPRA